jgi:hypothetical protein
MARVDDRRAAAQFHCEEFHVNEAQRQSESRARARPSAAHQKPEDERQRKIDGVLQARSSSASGNNGSTTENDKSRGARPGPRQGQKSAFRPKYRGPALTATLRIPERARRPAHSTNPG